MGGTVNAIGSANVTLTLATPAGRVVERRRASNATLDAYMASLTPVFAGALGAFDPRLSHVSVGAAGVTIERCESVTGWSGSPTLDPASFREGLASFRRTVGAGTAAVMTGPGVALDLARAGAIEVSVRVDVRARLDLASEALRLTTGPGHHRAITWATIEMYHGGALVDNAWTRVLLPKDVFSATGSPLWASVTSLTWTVTANLLGPLTAWLDDVRLVPAILEVSPATTSVDNEVARRPVASLASLGGGVVRASAFWTTGQIVGVHRLFGLYGNAGAALAAVVALPAPLHKTNLLTLTAEWDVSIVGS